MGIAVVRCDIVSGKIFKAYENIKVMADDEDISIQTAYYRTSKNTKPMNGEKYMFANDYMKMFPDTGAENMEGIKEKMVMDKNETYDNELELDKSPAVKKKPKKAKAAPKTKKAEQEPPKAEQEQPKAEPESTNPQPAADNSKGWVLEETAEAHPEYFGNGKLEELMEQIEKDESCWRRMSDILGPARMSVYAHCEALRHLLMAKDKPEEYANNMRRVAYYSSMAASMANRLEDKANG